MQKIIPDQRCKRDFQKYPNLTILSNYEAYRNFQYKDWYHVCLLDKLEPAHLWVIYHRSWYIMTSSTKTPFCMCS